MEEEHKLTCRWRKKDWEKTESKTKIGVENEQKDTLQIAAIWEVFGRKFTWSHRNQKYLRKIIPEALQNIPKERWNNVMSMSARGNTYECGARRSQSSPWFIPFRFIFLCVTYNGFKSVIHWPWNFETKSFLKNKQKPGSL